MRPKIRVGLYMYSPMMGGAEMYLKDLLWNLDRSRYDVTLFYDSWPDFDEYLELASCPSLTVCPIKVIEPSGHYGARTKNSNGVRGGATGLAALLDRLRGLKNYKPLLFGSISSAIALVLRYALVPLNLRRLTTAFRKHPVDILHIINGGYPAAQSAQFGPIAARLAGYPRCVMSVCNTPARRGFPKFLERTIDATIQKSVDRFLVPSDNLGRLLLQRRGFVSAQIAKVPYGVVDVLPQPSHTHAQQTLRPPRIGMVASLLAHKGHKHLIDAATFLLSRFPELKVEFVGDGPERPALIKKVAQLGLEKHVSFLGSRPLEETLELIRGWNVFVLSSELEGLPYVLLHAMSLAKPVVSTAVGAIPEVIVQDETGRIVPPADVPALTRAIDSLLSDPQHAARLGTAGRRRYEENFTREAMVARHQTLYDTLATQTDIS